MDLSDGRYKITINWSKTNLKVRHQYRLYRDDVLINTSNDDTIYVDYVTPGTTSL